jgi:hypothetical protein
MDFPSQRQEAQALRFLEQLRSAARRKHLCDEAAFLGSRGGSDDGRLEDVVR